MLSTDDLALVERFLDDAHALDCSQLNDHLQVDLTTHPRPGFVGALAEFVPEPQTGSPAGSFGPGVRPRAAARLVSNSACAAVADMGQGASTKAGASTGCQPRSRRRRAVSAAPGSGRVTSTPGGAAGGESDRGGWPDGMPGS